MKKIAVFIILVCTVFVTSVSCFAVQLPQNMTADEIFKIYSNDGIDSAVMVTSDGKSADISKEDLNEWLDVYRSFSAFERVIAPKEEYFSDRYYYYIKIKTADDRIYVIYENSSIAFGGYGIEYASHGELKRNYVWYMPYIGNARNALYTANSKLYEKYFINGQDTVRETTNEDKSDVHSVNLLKLDGCSAWSKNEIEKAAACNLLPYELTDRYTDAITRREFCELICRLIVTEFYPYSDSRMGMSTGVDRITDEKGIREKLQSAVYSDCDDERVKFLTAAGIVYGIGDGLFAPDSSLTREQATVILLRTAKFVNNKTMDEPDGDKYYIDFDKISTWARDGVEIMHELSVVKGIGDGVFAPKMTYSKEQAIATVLRLYETY